VFTYELPLIILS